MSFIDKTLTVHMSSPHGADHFRAVLEGMRESLNHSGRVVLPDAVSCGLGMSELMMQILYADLDADAVADAKKWVKNTLADGEAIEEHKVLADILSMDNDISPMARQAIAVYFISNIAITTFTPYRDAQWFAAIEDSGLNPEWSQAQ